MNRFYFLFFLFLIKQHVVFAGSQIFDVIENNYSVTKSLENTKSLLMNKELFNEISVEKEFGIKIPLLNDKFISVMLKRFSILSNQHNLIVEKDLGRQIQELQVNLGNHGHQSQ